MFFGRDVRRDAPTNPGKAPLVVLSHGLGGHMLSLGWLAEDLVQAGAVVVGLNHPNSTARDFDMQAGLRHWTRAQDVSAALDHVFATPALAAMVDPDRVAVIGFSYGGWTALSLAGVRGNLAGYAGYCGGAHDTSSHCADIAAKGGDLSKLDGALWDGDWRDARVASVVVIDPGLTWGLTAADAAGLAVPTHLIALGTGADRLSATDFSAGGSGFGALVPQAGQTLIAPAYHFSMLPLCRPEGPAILESERDDPVCTEPPGADRADIHAQTAAAVRAALGL